MSDYLTPQRLAELRTTADNANYVVILKRAEVLALLDAAKALVDADERLARAAFAVDSKHHIHGTTCLCGFEGNARKRTQTEHITAAVIKEYNRD